MFDLENYHKIQQIINNLGKKTKIVAISKNHPFEDVQEAISKGVEIFGENRVQEARIKFEDILKKIKIPKLECFSKSDYEKEYLGFYEKFLSDDE